MRILPQQTDYYKIIGDNLQMLIVTVSGSYNIFAEAGKMVYMKGNVDMETKMSSSKGKGFFSKLGKALERVIVGESLFLTFFKGNGEIGFAGDFPGRIIPIQLEDETILAQRDAFLAAIGDIDISIAVQKKIGAGLFGGEGFILEKISGKGIVFLHAGGDLVSFNLGPGETIKVDTGCSVAWDESVNYDIQYVGSIKTSIFGGEGLFLNTLTGPGTVILQTMPLSKLRRQLGGLGSNEKSENPIANSAEAGALGAVVGGIIENMLGKDNKK